MCYSAMVQQEAKKLGIKFKARVQLDLFEDLFWRRVNGEKIAANKAMERQFLENPKSTQEKKIAKYITDWRKDQLKALNAELTKQENRYSDAGKALKTKPTKKAEDDFRISQKKIDQILFKMKKLSEDDYVTEDEKSVFPFSYLSMVYVNEEGERVVAPFRYHLRPYGQPETFDRKYNGCYNARRDNLANPFWKPVFGKRHGIIVIHRFYEHVAVEDYTRHFKLATEQKGKKSLILEFNPEGVEEMIVPTIWDINKQRGKPDLYSCALLTDEPPEEIAKTGHNRCPIFLKEKNVDLWLNPKGLTLKELHAILDDKETPYYKHALVAA